MKTKTNVVSLLLLALPCLAVSGQCNTIPNPNPLCSEEPVASVVLKIVDAGGDALQYAAISFKINGAGPYTNACGGACGSVRLAQDYYGKFETTVSSPGYLTKQQTVNVELDELGCHPITQNVTVTMEEDLTVGTLCGAWYGETVFGPTTLRFDEDGKIVGAILYKRTIAGDHNFYIQFNDRLIRGVAGQQVWNESATDPTRNGNNFHFHANPVNSPIGFDNAALSSDFMYLTGVLQTTAVTYTRLENIPDALLDP